MGETPCAVTVKSTGPPLKFTVLPETTGEPPTVQVAPGDSVKVGGRVARFAPKGTVQAMSAALAKTPPTTAPGPKVRISA